ncbi:MAG TPA: hypothetical protein VGF48_11245 [Thermoanaerobaculia bacterium]|jgi:hypothetical protein
MVLIRAPLSLTSVLDESTEVVARTAAPWAAVLVATSVPYRLLQALFLDQLFEVGAGASRYGNLLGGTANLIVLATLLALWGRAVYARACRLALGRGTAPGREVWRVRPAAFASYVLTASAAIIAGALTIFTVVGYGAAVILSGLAIGTMELNERVSLTRPFALLARYGNRPKVPIALVFVFFCGLFVAAANVAFAFTLLVWLATAVGSIDAPNWPLLFSQENRRFLLMVFAGAVIAVEPFWVAAHVVFVRKAGVEESGDDLRAWFEELQRA